ncbi:HAD family hydrolase [Mycobacterium lepromatosis]|uniref:HAD family hydrolase n=1 Tax=Mycobacterium lepromatosis TaxID=480418 RepID=UPI0006793235|nr:HAD family hydrolase [Mycobacterium lepromatosis]
MWLITGDHPITATAIASEFVMAVNTDQIINSAEWDALSRKNKELAGTEPVTFTWMTPEHKVQIVQTLKRKERVCAMVDDGSNTAVGISAVGQVAMPAR